MKSESPAVTLADRRPLPDTVLGERRMPRHPGCVSSVRRFVRDVATDHEAAQAAVEIAQLLVSELATNALTHDSSTEPVRVVVVREGRLLTVEVRDSCAALPRMGQADPLACRGRGLAIVHRLSYDWGWNPVPPGKAVWFQVVAWTS
ncbi:MULTISPECIES: ATP-binding protein [unclassified Nonomuraea]|uniref:ATP-binding protein n=1 Tax=unclassified Nonomuraea TaxID=2593643 RepID=UPI0033E4A11D